jgi:large subunit ribosomal protein L15
MPLIRRIPKRGFNNAEHRTEYLPVNVEALQRFEPGTVVDEALLRGVRLIRGRALGIKVLGNGGLDRRLVVQAQAFSATARTKIEAAGGECQVVPRSQKSSKA